MAGDWWGGTARWPALALTRAATQRVLAQCAGRVGDEGRPPDDRLFHAFQRDLNEGVFARAVVQFWAFAIPR
jgi:hypothetical protein